MFNLVTRVILAIFQQLRTHTLKLRANSFLQFVTVLFIRQCCAPDSRKTSPIANGIHMLFTICHTHSRPHSHSPCPSSCSPESVICQLAELVPLYSSFDHVATSVTNFFYSPHPILPFPQFVCRALLRCCISMFRSLRLYSFNRVVLQIFCASGQWSSRPSVITRRRNVPVQIKGLVGLC